MWTARRKSPSSTTTLKSNVIGQDMARDNGALGYAFSVETGKRFGLNGPWSLTPQAQLIYSAVQSNFTDSFEGQRFTQRQQPADRPPQPRRSSISGHGATTQAS